MPKKPKDEDAPKHCGFIGYCALEDEKRFFAEGVENLRGLEKVWMLRNITVKNWCKGHKALGIVGDPRECRVILADITAKVKTANSPTGMLIANLRFALQQREKEISTETMKLGNDLMSLPF